MVKRVSNFLHRFFPLVTVFCILVTCVFVFPASAVGPAVDPKDSTTKTKPRFGVDFCYEVTSQSERVACTGSLADFAILGANSRFMYYVSYANKNIELSSYSSSEHTVANGVDYFRQVERFLCFDDSAVGQCPFRQMYFYFDTFAGYWNVSDLNRAFWMHDPGQWSFSCDFWFLADNGTLIRHYYTNSAYTSGVQSPIFSSHLKQIQDKYGIAEGRPFLVTNAKLSVTFTETTYSYTVSRDSSIFGSFNDTFSFPDEWQDEKELINTFLINIGINQPPAVIKPDTVNPSLLTTSFTDFMVQVATGFFDAELTPGLTMGSIFIIVIVFAVVIGVIKLLL